MGKTETKECWDGRRNNKILEKMEFEENYSKWKNLLYSDHLKLIKSIYVNLRLCELLKFKYIHSGKFWAKSSGLDLQAI